MDEKALAERLNRIEEQLKSLQAHLDTAKSSTRPANRLQRLCHFLLGNWVLLSFVFAVATAIYVKYEFGVDYLREYRSIKTKHDLADFYTRMGDILMGRGEWEAAEDAYRNAQQIDPENLAATRGIVKAQVFKPPAGKKYYIAEVVDAKLSYLLPLYPDDDQLMFLKGVRVQDQQDEKGAIDWFEKAITKNPKSLGSYVNLGFIYAGGEHFNPEMAINNLEKALRLDPDFGLAHSNLGFLYILSLNSDEALEHLKKSNQISSKWSTTYSLGEAHRYAGNFSQALDWHQAAMKGITDSKSENEPFLRESEVMWNYLPLNRQDHETIKDTVTVYDLDQKKAFTHYALSFDFAIENEFDKANKELEEALKLDKDHAFTSYFASEIKSIENLCSLNAAAKKWFENHKAKLGR